MFCLRFLEVNAFIGNVFIVKMVFYLCHISSNVNMRQERFREVVADMRFIPNPYWQPDLRPMTGQDRPVSDFVLGHPLAQQFLQNYVDVLDTLRTGYLNEGKRFVTIAIGCTGGKHRSVAMAEEIARRLREKGSPTLVVHRDLGRE